MDATPHRLALRWARRQYAVVAGLAAALLIGAGALPDPRGVPVAFAVLSAGLTGQLAINARTASRRERDFAETRAALEAQSTLLEALARTDAVTGVANRRGLMADLTTEVYRALRYRRPLSLLLVDIDHFKRVNDTHGHLFGDTVLQLVAARLRTALRASDIVARYGGEEFVIVLPETAIASAGLTAEKLRAAIEGCDFTDGERHARVSISVGVTMLTNSRISPAETARRLVARADRAMYAAKHAGRNRVRWDTDLPREPSWEPRAA